MQRRRWIGVLAILLAATAMRSAMAQAPRWITTNRWTGTGSRQTESVWINGAKWRIRYKPSGKGRFRIGVYDTDNTLLKVVTDQDRITPLNGHATLKGIGERYLAITGIDTTWEVTVEQYLTAIEEWHLRELLKQPKPKLLKIGVWTGDEGETEYTFTVPSASWHIHYEHSGEGFLRILVENDEGSVALATSERAEGKGSSWVHQPGTFTMKIRGVDVSWKIEVAAEQTAAGD